MKIETNREELSVNRCVNEKDDNFIAEGDVIVPDIKPDIINVINQSGNICIYKKEIMDGKLKIDGGVNVYVMYVPDSKDETVRSLNTVIDFSKIIEIESLRNGMSLEEQFVIKNIDCKILNGRKINIKCDIDMNIKLYSKEEISIIKNLKDEDDIKTLVSNMDINYIVGSGEVKTIGKENIRIDRGDNIYEVLNTSISIGNKDTKISYNKVITKADVEVKLLYLTSDNRINLIESKIPITGFVDIEKISDDNLCETNYQIKNIDIKPNSEEEHSIYAEIEVQVECKVYGKMQIELIQDMYSRKNELKFSKKQVEVASSRQCINEICNIREKITIPELANAEIYDAIVNPSLKIKDIINNKIVYQGNLNIKFLHSQDNIFGITEYDMPFAINVENDGIDRSFEINENIEIPMHDFIVMQGGVIETKLDLRFNISASKNQTINILDNIEYDENENNSNNYSMTIYFVKPKDTLWEIAKRFKSTVEEIKKINEIENENMIKIGQQLFLPR